MNYYKIAAWVTTFAVGGAAIECFRLFSLPAHDEQRQNGLPVAIVGLVVLIVVAYFLWKKAQKMDDQKPTRLR